MAAHSINLDARLIESRLVTAEELSRVRAAAGGAPDEAQLLDLLVRCNLLSKWQAAQLQAGKWKGFVLDHYRLLDPLGAGGMGQVFRALDAKTGRHVAIKLLPKRLATRDAIERFRREGQASLQMQHEHVVRCHELGHHGETHYLVMELVEGTTLAKFIQKKWLLSTKETARIGREVALALEHARQHGVIHRDIKPSNIMLTKKGSVKLADMGLAKFFDDTADRPASLTHTGAFMGTVDYCAPEQAEDAKRADTRSDIYSLGCTLYECLTGRVPFATGTSVQKIVAHREQEPTPVHEVNTEVPEFFSVLVTKRMLAKRPEDRFQSPAEAADALEPWARGEGRSMDAARLADLIDDEFQGVSAPPSGSTHRERRAETILPARRRGRTSSRGLALSAIGAVLRGLFVHRLSGTFIRLGLLVAVLIGLALLYRAGGRGGLRAIIEGPAPSGEPSGAEGNSGAPGKPTTPGSVTPPVVPILPGGSGPFMPPSAAAGMTMLDGVNWSRDAIGRLRSEGPDGYRKYCTELLDKFESAAISPTARNNLAWACVLAPGGAADPKRPLRLAESAAQSDPTRHAFLNTLGAARYRAADFAGAIQSLRAAITAHGKGGQPSDWLILAMAHQRLGQTTEAADSLDRAERTMRQDNQLSGNEELSLLHTEARSVVRPSATGGAPTPSTNGAVAPTLQQRRNLALWLRADEGVAVDSADRVRSWIDQSGDGHHASQTTSITQPLLVRNVLNGRPVIRFDGNDSLNLSGQVLTSARFSIFALVSDRASDESYRVIFSNWRGNPNSVFISTLRQNPRRARFTDDLGGYTHNSNFGVGAITTPGSHFILTGISSTNNALIYQNETLIAQRGSRLSPRNLLPPYVIGTQGTGGEFWFGDLAELLVYNAELSVAERQGVWAYFNEKYLSR